MDDETRQALDDLKGRCAALETLCMELFAANAILLRQYGGQVLSQLDDEVANGFRGGPIGHDHIWLTKYANRIRALVDGMAAIDSRDR